MKSEPKTAMEQENVDFMACPFTFKLIKLFFFRKLIIHMIWLLGLKCSFIVELLIPQVSIMIYCKQNCNFFHHFSIKERNKIHFAIKLWEHKRFNHRKNWMRFCFSKWVENLVWKQYNQILTDEPIFTVCLFGSTFNLRQSNHCVGFRKQKFSFFWMKLINTKKRIYSLPID